MRKRCLSAHFKRNIWLSKADALRVATSAIRDYLNENDITVSLVVFDKTAFEVSKDLLGAVESFVDEHYVEEHTVSQRSLIGVEEKALAVDYSEILILQRTKFAF